MVASIDNPFPIVLNQIGGGLNGGKLYIGEPGKDPEVFPVPVFWDDAETDPAAQPISIIGGYIVRAGTPAEIFAPPAYSVRVRDRNGAQVYYAARVSGPFSSDEISSTDDYKGAGLSGFSMSADYVDDTVGSQLQENTRRTSPHLGMATDDGPPSWATNYGIFNGFHFAVRDTTGETFPVTSMFGANAVSTPQGLVGSLVIDATSNPDNHGAGLAGYSKTKSTTKGAVGVFGGGVPSGDNMQAWQFNGITTNAGRLNALANTGFNFFTGWGAELDVNIRRMSDGSLPQIAIKMLDIVGDSHCGPSTGISATFRAVNINSPGIYQTPMIKFNEGFYTHDGAALIALSVGLQDANVASGSQPVIFRSLSDGGVPRQVSWLSDKDGNMRVVPDGGRFISLEATVSADSIAGRGSNPALSAGPGAGISPTITVTGNDLSGKVTITTGTGPSATVGDDIVTVVFTNGGYETACLPQISPANALSAQHMSRIFLEGDLGNFKLKVAQTGLAASSTYVFNYLVAG